MPFYLLHRYNPNEPQQIRKEAFQTEPEAVIRACALVMAKAQGDFEIRNDKDEVVTSDDEIRGRCKATRMP
jgi:hypothetical protein